MTNELWDKCLIQLDKELSSQQFNTWICPLQAEIRDQILELFAPNRFVYDWVQNNHLNQIKAIVSSLSSTSIAISLNVGSSAQKNSAFPAKHTDASAAEKPKQIKTINRSRGLRKELSFDSFVEGKSNQLARAASLQVASNPGKAYNPLFICGGVGLGKTHLMHAVGNLIKSNTKKPLTAVYLHSERFVADMVKALQHNKINEFKRYYRSVDALLIDDIQFFSGKERSQEEFFHTFNALLEGDQQIVLTCDRYPREVDGVEERLKSRFGWGLTVAVEPPELETRVAILMKKAQLGNINLPHEVAFFIGKRFRSNIRELEGALHRVIANAHFTGNPINIDFAKEALRDLLAMQDRLVTMENIQKTVAEYYKIRVSDLLSKRRSRSIARPRQMAMTLSKDLTSHSLPEIGDAFGGRDHSTVIHANKKIAELRLLDNKIKEDYSNLERTLTS